MLLSSISNEEEWTVLSIDHFVIYLATTRKSLGNLTVVRIAAAVPELGAIHKII